jgi:hypothetical protein
MGPRIEARDCLVISADSTNETMSDEISDTDLDWYVSSPVSTVAAIAEELRRRRREARTAAGLIQVLAHERNELEQALIHVVGELQPFQFQQCDHCRSAHSIVNDIKTETRKAI